MQALNSFTVRHWHQGATARLSAAPKAVAPAISTAVVAENKSPYQRRQSRHFRLRKRVSGTPERPRLAVFRSNQHIYAQVIDDTQSKTLFGLGTVSEAVKAELEGDKKSKTKNKTAAEVVGRKIAEKCKEMGVEKVVFDRGGFLYHGRVAALADAAREGGLIF